MNDERAVRANCKGCGIPIYDGDDVWVAPPDAREGRTETDYYCPPCAPRPAESCDRCERMIGHGEQYHRIIEHAHEDSVVCLDCIERGDEDDDVSNLIIGEIIFPEWVSDPPTEDGWYPVWVPDLDQTFVVRVEVSVAEGDPDDVRHYWESTPDLPALAMVGMLWDHRPVQFLPPPEVES